MLRRQIDLALSVVGLVLAGLFGGYGLTHTAQANQMARVADSVRTTPVGESGFSPGRHSAEVAMAFDELADYATIRSVLFYALALVVLVASVLGFLHARSAAIPRTVELSVNTDEITGFLDQLKDKDK